MKPGAKYHRDAEFMRPLIRQQLAQVEAARQRREATQLALAFGLAFVALGILVALTGYAGGAR